MYFSKWYRHPKTTQERRANQCRNDPYVRGKRRKLPTAYDDLIVCKQKSWKKIRNHQYKVGKEHYDWHEFEYSHWNIQKRMIAHNIIDWLNSLGCYYETKLGGGIKWYGPKWGDL